MNERVYSAPHEWIWRENPYIQMNAKTTDRKFVITLPFWMTEIYVCLAQNILPHFHSAFPIFVYLLEICVNKNSIHVRNRKYRFQVNQNDRFVYQTTRGEIIIIFRRTLEIPFIYSLDIHYTSIRTRMIGVTGHLKRKLVIPIALMAVANVRDAHETVENCPLELCASNLWRLH